MRRENDDHLVLLGEMGSNSDETGIEEGADATDEDHPQARQRFHRFLGHPTSIINSFRNSRRNSSQQQQQQQSSPSTSFVLDMPFGNASVQRQISVSQQQGSAVSGIGPTMETPLCPPVPPPVGVFVPGGPQALPVHMQHVLGQQQQEMPQQQQHQHQHHPHGRGGMPPRETELSVSAILGQIFGSSPELVGLMNAMEKYIPFLCIVAIKGLFEHSTGIFVCLALIGTFFHANSVVCREVSRNGRRAIWPLVIVMVNLTACIVFIYFVFQDDKLYLCTMFLPTGRVESLYELLWIVGVNDFVLKFAAVIIKIAIILLPANILQHRKRGNYFLFVEMTSQLHRSLVPIPVWLHYLLDNHEKLPSKVIGVMLTAAYMVFKGKSILRSALLWKSAATKLLQSTSYGNSPSNDEMKASGGTCPICHDSLNEPTILHCKHIFCEECVATWFDRERTCPMCRAQVTEDPAWRDGSTSQFIQLF